MLLKVSFFFKAAGYGWSENHYYDGAIATAETDAMALARLRINMCGTGVNLSYIRLSDDAFVRDASVVTANLYTQTNGTAIELPANANQDPNGGVRSSRYEFIKPAVPTVCDFPFTALLTRFSADNLNWVMHYLRGLPDALTDSANILTDSEPWYAAYEAWKKRLYNGKWKMKTADRTPGTAPLYKVKDVLNSGTGTAVFTALGNDFGAGQVVSFTGFKGYHAVTGRRIVSAPDPLTGKFTVGGIAANMVVEKMGSVRKYVSKVSSITDIQTRYIGGPKTGRPFDSPRGRRKRRN